MPKDTTCNYDRPLGQDALRALLTTLREAKPVPVPAGAEARIDAMLGQDFIYIHQVGDWLYSLGFDLDALAARSEGFAAFGIRTEELIRRPKLSKLHLADYVGSIFPAVTPAQLTAFLIRLENIGLDTHPELWTARLLPELRRKPYLTGEECTVVLHKTERGKMSFHYALGDPALQDCETTSERFTTPNGTQVWPELTQSGAISQLWLHR